MSQLIRKLIDRLLNKSEKISGSLTQNEGEEDWMQKKINNLIQKRDLLKHAIRGNVNPEGSQDTKTRFTPPKQTHGVKNHKHRTSRRGKK